MARYYPNGSNRPKNRDNPLAPGNDNQHALEQNAFAEWLYTAEWNEENLRTFELLYSYQYTRGYIDYLLDLREDSNYMARYGLTPADIKDPRRLKSVSSASRLYGATLNFVSDIAKYLYR